LGGDHQIEAASQVQLVQVARDELDVLGALALGAGPRRLQGLAALVDGHHGSGPPRHLHAERAGAAAQVRHVQVGQEAAQGARPELEGLPRLEQPFVERLPVLTAAEQLREPGEIAVGVGPVLDRHLDERPAGVVLLQVERVVGESVLPLLHEELHRLELAQVVRDAGLGDAHQRDQLAHVQGRLGDQPQDAQTGGVA